MNIKSYGGLELLIVNDFAEMSAVAADLIIRRVTDDPELNMLVPTGTTPTGVYAHLSEQPPERFAGVSFYNMDEYCVRKADGSFALLAASDEHSYHHYMQEHLLGTLTTAKSFFPGIENVNKPGTYDQFITQNGGLDLCLNAIGEDGHTFGFNIPGSSFSSKTRLVALDNGTKGVNQKLTGFETPEFAVSTGLLTGMMAREVILLVSGERKAEILKRVLTDEVVEDIPATILRGHPKCTWIVDQAAASKL